MYLAGTESACVNERTSEREKCALFNRKREQNGWREYVQDKRVYVCIKGRGKASVCRKKREREGEQMCVCKREIVRMCACVVMESRRRDRECVCVSDRRIIGEEGKCLRV